MQGQSACALVTIPGFTQTVQDLFLEDVLERTGFTIGRGSKCVPEMFDGLNFCFSFRLYGEGFVLECNNGQ